VKAAIRAAQDVAGTPRSIGTRIHARQGQCGHGENDRSHESLLGR
jgi:hypothetical protein